MIQYYKEPLGWVVENDSFDSQTLAKCEAVFAQSNGYMGIHSASMGGLWQCAALGFAEACGRRKISCTWPLSFLRSGAVWRSGLSGGDVL